MKKSIKSICILVGICAVLAILLALTNAITAPIIEKNQREAAYAALLEVMPEGQNFVELDLDSYTLDKSIKQVYVEDGGGYVFTVRTKGYASGLLVMCAISADGTIAGTKVLSSAETPSIGGVAADVIAAQLIGKTEDSASSVDVVADATKTSEGYLRAVALSYDAMEILKGAANE